MRSARGGGSALEDAEQPVEVRELGVHLEVQELLQETREEVVVRRSAADQSLGEVRSASGPRRRRC
ncbi:MAG: hypothetical protein ACOYOI_09490, partial [Chthoniobacterales bacterium]